MQIWRLAYVTELLLNTAGPRYGYIQKIEREKNSDTSRFYK